MAALLAILVVLTFGLLAGALLLWSRLRAQAERDARNLSARANPYSVNAATDGDALVQGRSAVDRLNPVTRWATVRLTRIGITPEPDRVNLLLIGAITLVVILLAILGLTLGGLAVVALVSIAWLWANRRASQRRRAILGQLPDYLDHVLRILSAGNSLEDALRDAAREAREPLSGLFIGVARQVRLGAAVEDVLAQQAELHGLSDLNAMAMAASVNRQYGGSLRRILKSLAAALRARDIAGRELRALTAEARVSAWVLVSVTVFLTGWVLYQNPQYYAEMWSVWATRLMLITSIGLQLTGILVIYRMVRSTERAG